MTPDFLIDFHNDTILKIVIDGEDFINGSARLHIDLPKIARTGDIGALFFAVCCYGGIDGFPYYARAMELVRRVKKMVSESSAQLKLATNADDLEAAIGDKKTAISTTTSK